MQFDTFIIGAGASKVFGMPVGDELCHSIIHLCKNSLLDQKTYSASFQREFGLALEASIQYGIDRYLQMRQEYIPIGKHAILSVFSELETNDSLYAWNRENWMRHLFQDAVRSENNFLNFSERTKLIIFNYDRAVEHYLVNALKSNLNIKNNKAFELLRKLEIIHPYGTLGHLPNDPQASGFIKAFAKEDAHALVDKAERYENMDFIRYANEVKNEAILKIMSQTKRLFFLGFGFDDINMKLIGFPEIMDKISKKYGTAFQWRENEVSEMKDRYRLDLRNLSCINLLKDCWSKGK